MHNDEVMNLISFLLRCVVVKLLFSQWTMQPYKISIKINIISLAWHYNRFVWLIRWGDHARCFSIGIYLSVSHVARDTLTISHEQYTYANQFTLLHSIINSLMFLCSLMTYRCIHLSASFCRIIDIHHQCFPVEQ